MNKIMIERERERKEREEEEGNCICWWGGELWTDDVWWGNSTSLQRPVPFNVVVHTWA